MKRRNFFKQGAVAGIGTGFILSGCANPVVENKEIKEAAKKAKNVIFLVSDGMSTGTLTMADQMLQRKEGRGSTWVDAIRNGTVKRGQMDTSSASSIVTDSAAGGSAWGGGVRIPNGKLNESASGEQFKPILQKFKAVGKSVGCVTTVPITHATPASFCVSYKTRKDQAKIAELYLPLKFDVMMGGGDRYFNGEKRKDGLDLYGEFSKQGYKVFRNRNEMNAGVNATEPVLGVYDDNALPYAVDRATDKELQDRTPSIVEMTEFALNKLKQNKNGFALQIEGGKVDWAAHSNDVGGLIYDQIEFDKAVKVALDFAANDKETLVIITTDHGNGNPGLFYGDKANDNFDNIQKFKHSNTWILTGQNANFKASELIELVEYAQNYVIKKEEAEAIVKQYRGLSEEDLLDPYKLPFEDFAMMQRPYTSVHFGDMHHSSDFVEVAAYGPGSELLNPFILNTELHNLMLTATGVKETVASKA